MATLNWIGKEAVVNHDKDVPFKLLEKIARASVGKESKNLIIQGDNLEALKALMPFYKGKVDCIYIDPPYNTGNEGWVYNDKVNSPKIREWLKSVVGKEGEDLTRHDKWLCMMYPRLNLLKDLLNDNGVIFLSIDDNESDSSKRLLDEIFLRKNFVGTIIWKNVTDNNPSRIAVEHEYIHCYAKDISKVSPVWKSTLSEVKEVLIKTGNELIKKYSDQQELQEAYTAWFRENKAYLGKLDRYKYIDKGGVYTGSQSVHNPGKEGYRYDVLHPVTKKPTKQPLMGYRFPESTMKELIKNGKILYGNDENKIIELKLYVHEYSDKLPSLIELDGRLGMYDLRDLFADEIKVFDNPKPVSLIKQLLSYATSSNALILDSFAGSGTTAQAVLDLNSEDEGNRNFILVEMEEKFAEKTTAERIKRAIKKYKYKDGFQFSKLGKPLFNARGQIDDSCSFEDLASYIYFTETQAILDKKVISKPYIGENSGISYYLMYSGRNKNDLTRAAISKLSFKNSAVVYADRCLVDEDELAKKGITFKQIPYEITVY